MLVNLTWSAWPDVNRLDGVGTVPNVVQGGLVSPDVISCSVFRF